MKFRFLLFLLCILFFESNIVNARDDKTKEEALHYLEAGNICYAKSQYEDALTNYFKALSLYEQINDKTNISTIYTNIAGIYIDMNSITQAEKYVNKALPLAIELNDSLRLAQIYNKFMRIRHVECKPDECLQYAERCINLFPAVQNYPNLLCAKNTMASIYIEKKQYAKAFAIAKEALDMSEKEGLEDYIIESKWVMIDIYHALGELNLAEQYALDILSRMDSTDYRLLPIYKLLVRIYAQKGDYSKLVDNLEIMLSVLNKENDQMLASALMEMELKYETEKKELKIDALEEEKRLMIWLSFAVGGVLLLIIVASLLLWRWAVEKKRISEQQVKQLQQEKQLIATQAILDGEVQERTRLANDLHDGLGSMLTGIKLNLELMKKAVSFNEEEEKHFNNAMKILNDSMTDMRRVAHHLMPNALSQYGLKAALKDFCEHFDIIEFEWFGNGERLNDRKKEVMIYYIIHELVNNALKHSGATKIMVNVMRDEDYIAITVCDNGCGFNRDKPSQGVGLQNIRERISAYNGRYEIVTKMGEGTEVNVELVISG
jgi:signal transduction histidine kinase